MFLDKCKNFRKLFLGPKQAKKYNKSRSENLLFGHTGKSQNFAVSCVFEVVCFLLGEKIMELFDITNLKGVVLKSILIIFRQKH